MDFDCVFGGDEGAVFAFFIAFVVALLFEDFFEGDRFPAAGEFVPAALGAGFGGGGEEEFELRPRERDGALIAAFGNVVAARSDLTLERDESLADARVIGGVVNLRSDFGRANAGRDVFAEEEDFFALEVEFHFVANSRVRRRLSRSMLLSRAPRTTQRYMAPVSRK